MRGGGAANQASVLSWGPLLGLGVVLVLVGGLLRRRDRRADKPLLDSGANVTPLQKPRQPPGSTARTG